MRRRLAIMLVSAIGWGLLPDAASLWWLPHPESWVAGHDVSSAAEVPVRPSLAASWARDGVRVNRTALLHGTVAPATGRLRLEWRVDGTWRRVRLVPVAADGSFQVSVRPRSVGFEHYRLVRPGEGPPASVATLPRLDVYRLHTYVVRARGHVADVKQFAAGAAEVYADPRGWRRAHHRFARVRSRGDFTLVYAAARQLPAYSRVCSSFYSCRVGRNVIINQDRWRRGSPRFTGDLATYRAMVVNHETGHWLGRGHAHCSGPGRRAPVMQQQSKGLHGCRPNPWPLDREIREVR